MTHRPHLFRSTRAMILVVAVAAILRPDCSTPAAADEFQPLFDGKTLNGWVVEGNPGSDKHPDGRPVWSVADGLIHCEGKGFGFLRYDREPFDDFTFHVEFRMAAKCNSGIGVRTRVFDPKQSRATRPSIYSYEIQIVDETKPISPTSNGSLYRYVAPKSNPLKSPGEWNTIEVTCVGPRIRVVLNGVEIQNVDQSTIEALKSKPLKGFVCLQNHGGRIDFRNVKIKRIAASDTH
ncbi:MAG: DUF1080 domain-containing protein [Isosphaeraceae bacterium]